jgi:hypothetical protein
MQTSLKNHKRTTWGAANTHTLARKKVQNFFNLPYSKKEEFTPFVTSDSEDCGTGRVILGAVDMFL